MFTSSDLAKDFVEKLLVKESSKRLTAKNALNHEWLNCTKGNSEREITLSLTKTKLKRYVILRRLVSNHCFATLYHHYPHLQYLAYDFLYLFSWRKAALSIMFLNKLNKLNSGHSMNA